VLIYYSFFYTLSLCAVGITTVNLNEKFQYTQLDTSKSLTWLTLRANSRMALLTLRCQMVTTAKTTKLVNITNVYESAADLNQNGNVIT